MNTSCSESELRDFVHSSISEERWIHTCGVIDLAERLSSIYDLPRKPLKTVSLLHDNARGLPLEDQRSLARQFRGELDSIEESVSGLLHAPAGAQRMIEKLDYSQEDSIPKVVGHHSTGAPDPGPLLSGLLVADFAEPNRDYPEATRIRERIDVDPLVDLVHETIRLKIKFLMDDSTPIHPRSVETFNSLCE